jgi:hypothetical protein
MVAWHEEILPAVELFCSCRRKNCNVPTERKGIYVVGLVCAGAAHQRERGYLEGIQEVFREEILD